MFCGSQNLLLAELLSLQQQLPPSLLQLPPAEQCSSAGAVLQFYQQQLSNALDDHRACAAALGGLQRIGNCLALLYLLSAQQATEATPTFMQVRGSVCCCAGESRFLRTVHTLQIRRSYACTLNDSCVFTCVWLTWRPAPLLP